MTQTITIAGKAFEVEPRYAEGHTLTANEASALNQTYFENLRNNFAGKAKDGSTQEDFTAYATAYQFGVRVGGGGSRDPVETEAMNLAREAVKAGIKAKGKNISDFTAKAVSEAAAKLLDRDPAYRERAKARVEEMQSNASAALSDELLAELEAAPAPAPATSGEGSSAPTKGKKAAA